MVEAFDTGLCRLALLLVSCSEERLENVRSLQSGISRMKTAFNNAALFKCHICCKLHSMVINPHIHKYTLNLPEALKTTHRARISYFLPFFFFFPPPPPCAACGVGVAACDSSAGVAPSPSAIVTSGTSGTAAILLPSRPREACIKRVTSCAFVVRYLMVAPPMGS